jgi:hypothetical protein
MEPMSEQPRQLLDVRRLPGTRESLVYCGGGLFPVLTLAPDGAVVAVLRGGAGHLGLAGRIEVVRSSDGGATWSPPAVVADTERDDRNPAFGTSPAGTLVLGYHRTGCYDERGLWAPSLFAGRAADAVEIMTTRSVDGGLTWERPSPLGVPALAAGSPYGKIVSLPGGTLLMAVYQEDAGVPDRSASWVVRSDDDGRSWIDPTPIAVGFNETALGALPDGAVLAVMRGDPAEDGLSVTRSTDGGRSWTAPARLTGPSRHPADLATFADGSILVTYGCRTPPYRIEGRVSRDGGRTWLNVLLVFSGHLYGYTVEEPRPTDLGYPSTVIARPPGGERRGVTVYYYSPSLRQAGSARIRTRTPFYDQADYLAVAVTWHENALLAALDEIG